MFRALIQRLSFDSRLAIVQPTSSGVADATKLGLPGQQCLEFLVQVAAEFGADSARRNGFGAVRRSPNSLAHLARQHFQPALEASVGRLAGGRDPAGGASAGDSEDAHLLLFQFG